MVPPPGMASRALMHRLSRALSSCGGSMKVGHGRARKRLCKVMDGPMVRRTSSSMPCTSAATSVERGCKVCWRRRPATGVPGPTLLRRAAGQRQQWLKLGVTLLAQALLHQLLGIDDAAQQVIEVMGDATAELADGLHFLRLAQRLLGLGQAPLLLNPVSDVVGKQISALHAAVMLAQGVETQLIVAWPEPADLGEPLPASARRHIGMIRSWSAGWLASTAGRYSPTSGCGHTRRGSHVWPGG